MGVYKKLLAGTLLGLYLGISDGYLAIFQTGKVLPEQVLPYSREVFTEDDQVRLERGIPFSTDAELSRLLEDFTS